MTEWQVVLVIIALFGFITAVTTPIIKLNTSITKLTSAVQRLEEKLDESKEDNHEAHKRLWEHNECQDKMLTDHDQRLHDLDGK
jgi:ABC-type bacteriocin/lantibiotic exporter with double-glycine peptidase domain